MSHSEQVPSCAVRRVPPRNPMFRGADIKGGERVIIDVAEHGGAIYSL